jgi:simple sugar transport system substrate-binding protein
MMIKRRGLSSLAVGMTLALGLAACTSQGGRQEEEPQGGGNAAGGSVDTERYNVAMVTHAPPGDNFWDKIRTGAEDAAGALNIELNYTTLSTGQGGPEQATLVQNAIDQKVDGLAVTLATPDAVGPAAQNAVNAGIPVVAFNAGLDQYQEYGILMYFGSDERIAGEAVGTRLTEKGPGKAICVIQEQGQVQLETRCEGVRATFPSTENLQVQGTDAASVRQTIGAKLQQDPAITYIVTLGAQFAEIANDAKADAGSDAQVATFDMNAEVAQAVADGNILFSVDQQPYVQGFLAVQSLWMNLTNGNDIGGGGPVLTGPSFVDSENIDVILPFAKAGTR